MEAPATELAAACEPASDGREAPQRAPVGGFQQPPRPLEGGSHAAARVGAAGGLRGQRVEVLLDGRADRRERQHADPGGRELEPERQALGRAADAEHVAEIGGVRAQARANASGRPEEEPDRVGTFDLVGRRVAEAVHEALRFVAQQQGRAVAEGVDDARHRLVAGSDLDVERIGHRVRHGLWSGERAARDVRHAGVEGSRPREVVGGLQRHPRLADARRAGQHDDRVRSAGERLGAAEVGAALAQRQVLAGPKDPLLELDPEQARCDARQEGAPVREVEGRLGRPAQRVEELAGVARDVGPGVGTVGVQGARRAGAQLAQRHRQAAQGIARAARTAWRRGVAPARPRAPGTPAAGGASDA